MYIMYNQSLLFYTQYLIPLTPVKSKRTHIHRGQALATAVEITGLGKEEVASKAGYSRSAYYKHIENPQLEYHILIAYGRAIGHDFTEEFPDMPRYSLEEPEEKYAPPQNLAEAIRLSELWKDKYLELLEKYNRLIEERLSKKS